MNGNDGLFFMHFFYSLLAAIALWVIAAVISVIIYNNKNKDEDIEE